MYEVDLFIYIRFPIYIYIHIDSCVAMILLFFISIFDSI